MSRSEDISPTDSDIPEDIFTQTDSTSKVSRIDRVKQFFDVYVRAPLSVAMEDYRTIIGGGIILFFILIGTVGTAILPEPRPFEGDIFLSPFQDPNLILGTGSSGQDLFKQLVHSTPTMFKMIFTGAVLSVGLGSLIGAIAGYKGGVIDKVLMTITDLVLTIPGIVLVILLATIYQPRSPYIVGIILGIDNWPGLARTIRSQVLSIREEAVVEASRVMGLSETTIMRKNIISNLMPYISINFANGSRGIIFESVALYFLGILPFSSLNWGVMMNEAYQSGNLTNWGRVHWMLEPMITIMLLSLGFVLFAQGLDRVFNVRLRARHAKTISEEETEPE